MPRLIAIAIALALIILPMRLIERMRTDDAATELVGEVHDERGPVEGALVRIKGTKVTAVTDDNGRFRIAASTGVGRITAAKDGYFIAGADITGTPLVLRLHRLPANDCTCYEWVAPHPDAAAPMNCGNCHKAIHAEWAPSGHARSAVNRRLVNLYEGSDWHGRADIGWNLLKEHPDGADVCSSCHAPTQKSGPFGSFDLRDARRDGDSLSGVHCDFCHKVRGPGDGEFGLTHGRYQLSLLRPSGKHQLFFGPLDDVDRGDDAFSPFQRDSRMCAACHEGVVFGVPVYSTFSEWQASPSGAINRSCQSCHMKPSGMMQNIAPGRGGIRRDPMSLGNHHFFAGSQLEMLRGCLDLETVVRHDAENILLDVTLTAEGVGHRVPTGYIDRQVILFVEAFERGKRIDIRSGPRLPSFLGRDEAGQPGRLFARSLQDATGKRPAPFWRADPASLEDTRLTPHVPDRMSFEFPKSVDRVRIRVVHRRFWKTIADEKGWPSDELLILEREVRPIPSE